MAVRCPDCPDDTAAWESPAVKLFMDDGGMLSCEHSVLGVDVACTSVNKKVLAHPSGVGGLPGN